MRFDISAGKYEDLRGRLKEELATLRMDNDNHDLSERETIVIRTKIEFIKELLEDNDQAGSYYINDVEAYLD